MSQDIGRIRTPNGVRILRHFYGRSTFTTISVIHSNSSAAGWRAEGGVRRWATSDSVMPPTTKTPTSSRSAGVGDVRRVGGQRKLDGVQRLRDRERRRPPPLLDLRRQADDLDLDDLADPEVGRAAVRRPRARPRAPTARSRRASVPGALDVGADLVDHPGVDGLDQVGALAEQLVERAGGDSRRRADPADGAGVVARRAEDLETLSQQPLATLVVALLGGAAAPDGPVADPARDPPSTIETCLFNATIRSWPISSSPGPRPGAAGAARPRPDAADHLRDRRRLERHRRRQGALRGAAALRLLRARQRHRRHLGLRNSNGQSACYETLEINTSCPRMSYSDFPMPADYPAYAAHHQVADYFQSYVDHFGFRHTITFDTRVDKVEPTADGRWLVTFTGPDGPQRDYDNVVVANGHHWDARLPEPAYPGTFDGEQIHSHAYSSADSSPVATWSSSVPATRRWTSRSRPRRSRGRQSSRSAAASGSCRSSCSASPPTRSPCRLAALLGHQGADGVRCPRGRQRRQARTPPARAPARASRTPCSPRASAEHSGRAGCRSPASSARR